MARPKKSTGYNAGYLTGLSKQADDADIFGSDVAQKHEALQQEVAAADQSQLPQIAIVLLHDNPYQSRRGMDEEELQKLAADIKETGFQGALAARPHPTEPEAYQIVWGHRRRKAAEIAGLSTLPVLVKEHSDEEMLFLQAKENLLREQLTPLDEAFMFQSMLDMGYTQVLVAEKVRQSRGYVRNRLELLKAPEDVQEMVRKDKDTLRAAYYLKDIAEEWIRTDLIEAVLGGKLTGESIPGYLATLREQERLKQERQAQDVASSIPLPASSEMPASSPILQSMDRDMVQPLSAVPAEAIQDPVINVSQESVIKQPGEQQPRSAVDDKEVQAYVEAGKLRKILNQLESYQKRLGEREPSSSEWIILSSIERLAHSLQGQGTAAITPANSVT